MALSQTFGGQYTTEWQWSMKNGEKNWVNLLRLEINCSLWKNGTLEAATIHIARTNDERIIQDRQIFSNIEEENNCAAIAVLGYMHSWKHSHLFIGVRNVNEDFFTSPCTSLFTNSSCGIFPTISANYPIANYPLSGLTVYFDMEWQGFTLKNSIYNGMGFNGWNRHDNPFLFRPHKDGIFDMLQLEYAYLHGVYFAGLSVHNCSLYDNGDNLKNDKRTTSCSWWIYTEQPVWICKEKEISVMAQYSENTDKHSVCSRYGELGCIYTHNGSRIGTSFQYAKFGPDNEYSAELTWQKRINKNIDVQPAFQFIKNSSGTFTVFQARICYGF